MPTVYGDCRSALNNEDWWFEIGNGRDRRQVLLSSTGSGDAILCGSAPPLIAGNSFLASLSGPTTMGKQAQNAGGPYPVFSGMMTGDAARLRKNPENARPQMMVFLASLPDVALIKKTTTSTGYR